MPRLRLALAMLPLTACQAGVCTAGELSSALDAAGAGDVVTVGPCEIRGAFTVPAGVTLRGAGALTTLGSIEGGAAVLDLSAGSATRLEALTIAVDHGGYGVRARGARDVVVRELAVTVTRGIALGLRDGSATLVGVQLDGPIDATNAATAPSDPALTGAFGLTALDSTIHLEALRARGFAVGAVTVEGGALEWIDDDDVADVEATLDMGIGLFGVRATLDGVEVSGMLSGFDRPGFAIVAATSSTGAPTELTATGARIATGEGYGVLSDGSDVVLESVTIEELGLVGVHAQAGGSLRATDVVVRGNGGAGLAAIDLREVVLERSTFSEQRTASLTDGGATVRAADGVHVRRTSASAAAIDLVATDVTLIDNARTGLLIDAADTAPGRLALSGVRVGASDPAALGAIAQRAMVPAGWDAGVVREGVTISNDASFVGTIDPVGILMPPTLVARPPAP
ncbi:MAG: right-handed parallel beta-helix repeat-containing protein [Sandaracinaceae bacterium]|nr:right-handed parallel beta-helix repeat-containing protein [Sandaracinaceae bacterium]